MKRGFILILLGFFVGLFTVQAVNAEWIDDWIQQKTTTSADYLEGQKRGFATFGSFSARWSPGNDYLVTLTPPGFKAGCGGIDVFLGGFSFLNADYLVQKLQNMLSAAPAVAFDMALSALCEQCSKTVKSLEAASSRLNQLQFDDCKAAKAGTAVLLSDIFSQNDKLAAQKSLNVADFVQSTGLQNMWQDVKRIWESATNKTPSGVAKQAGATGADQMVSGCPSVVTQVFFTAGSLLDHVAGLRGYSLDYVDLIRGYVGDINVLHNDDDYAYELVAPCPQNTPEKIDGLVQGDVYERSTPSANCTQITSLTIDGNTYPNVRTWVFTVLNNICTKMTTNAALNTSEENFLKPLPLPIYKAIVADIQAQGSTVSCSSIADLYADTVSAAYAYAMVTDFYDIIKKAIVTAETIAANQQGPQNPGDKDHCKLEVASDALTKLQIIQKRVPPYIQAAREQYGVKLTGLLSHKEYATKVEEFNFLVRDFISSAFSKGLSDRVVSP